LLLFPDGRLPSRRWRPVGWSAGASVGAVCLGYAYAGRPGHGGSPERSPAVVVPELVLVVAVLASVAALAVRWRASAGDVRQQCKWVMWGAAVAALGFLIGIATVDVLPAPASPALIAGGFAVLIASYGLAIGRYRLYGVDLVISRTIVFVAL